MRTTIAPHLLFRKVISNTYRAISIICKAVTPSASPALDVLLSLTRNFTWFNTFQSSWWHSCQATPYSLHYIKSWDWKSSERILSQKLTTVTAVGEILCQRGLDSNLSMEKISKPIVGWRCLMRWTYAPVKLLLSNTSSSFLLWPNYSQGI